MTVTIETYGIEPPRAIRKQKGGKGPCASYIIFGQHDGVADSILYIGISKDPRQRLSTHRCHNKDTWWPKVTRVEIHWYEHRWQASRIETAQIRAHRPPHNPVVPQTNGSHVTVSGGWPQKPPVGVRPYGWKTARVHDDTWEAVRRLATQRGTRMSDVVEVALSEYLDQHCTQWRAHVTTDLRALRGAHYGNYVRDEEGAVRWECDPNRRLVEPEFLVLLEQAIADGHVDSQTLMPTAAGVLVLHQAWEAQAANMAR